MYIWVLGPPSREMIHARSHFPPLLCHCEKIINMATVCTIVLSFDSIHSSASAKSSTKRGSSTPSHQSDIPQTPVFIIGSNNNTSNVNTVAQSPHGAFTVQPGSHGRKRRQIIEEEEEEVEPESEPVPGIVSM